MDRNSGSGSWSGWAVSAAVVAYLALAMAVFVEPPKLSVPFVVAALAVLTASAFDRRPHGRLPAMVVVPVAAAFLAMAIVRAPSWLGWRWWVVPAVGAILVMSGLVGRPSRRWTIALLAILSVIVVMVGAVLIRTVPDPFIDVFDLHVAAADAIRSGANPYVAATALDTSPFAEPGSVIHYPYPPLVLLAYAGSALIAGDPRWAGVVALIASMWLVALAPGAAARRTGLVLAALLLLFPQVFVIIGNGWTEPLTVPLLIAAAMSWRARPTASAVLLGLALATKQYFVLALPLLLFLPDDHRWRRLAIAGGVAAALVAPAFIADVPAAWEALVVFHVTRPPRLDARNLAGWDVVVPAAVWASAVIAASVPAARRVDGGGRFLMALTLPLMVAFLLGSQAFTNYWFLIGAVALGGAAVMVAEGAERSDVEARGELLDLASEP